MHKLVAYISNSTLKREFAVIITLWFLIMATKAAWFPGDAEHFAAQKYVIDLVYNWVFGIATLAFGADFLAKQTNVGGPPTPSVTTTTVIDNPLATTTVTTEPTGDKG